MLFTSLDYFVLLLASAALYWLTPFLRVRQLVLLAASIIFYASWMPIFLLLLLFVMAVNFFAALHVRTARQLLEEFATRTGAVVVNLGIQDGLDGKLDYADHRHLSGRGAAIFSKELAKTLVSDPRVVSALSR